MKHQLALRLAALTILQATPAFAQSQVDACLGFGEAIDMASETSPAAAIARAGLEGARAGADEVKSIRRPQVTSFLRSAAGDEGLVDSQFENQIGIRASQRLFDFGDTKRATQAASQMVQSQVEAVQAAQNDSALEVGLQYVAWLEADALLTVTSDRTSYFSEQKSILLEAIENGGATAAELAEVAAELAIAEADALDLELSKSNAAAALSWNLSTRSFPCEGSFKMVEGSLAGVPGRNSIDDWVTKAESQNPSLKSLKSEVSNLEIQAQRQSRARLPKIDLVGTASYAGDSEFGNFEYRDRIGVDVSVPLLSGSSLNARAREAKSEALRSSNELLLLKRDLSLQLEQAYQRILILETQKLARDAVQTARNQEFAAIEAEFDAGLSTRSKQIEARLELEAAAINAVQIRADLMRTKLRLLWLAGDLSKFAY